MSNKVAIAMSVYKSDSVEYLTKAVESLLEQSYRNIVIFICVDGTVEDKLSEKLKSYSLYDNVNVLWNDDNLGLAARLNDIIEIVISDGTFSFLARMDADDISAKDRVEKQVNFLLQNRDISVVGSDVIEINDFGQEIFYKRMDSNHEDMVKKIIKKCPFNHPSVMFDINVFKSGYRYNPSLKNTQDYYLWIDLISSGFIFSNINEPLLYFRVNSNFHSRRGFKKALNDLKSRVYALKKLDVVSITNIIHIMLLFSLRISPSFIKAFAYKYFR